MKKIVLLIALLAFPVFAQERALTAAEKKQLGELVPHLLETLYVIPEKGNELAATVRASFANGRYDAAKTTAALAEAINSDLAPANDKHLGIRASANDAAKPPLTVEAWKTRRAAMAGGPPMMRDVDRDAFRRMNFGVLGAEVLEGNVGYLKMGQFVESDEARAALASAMALLANTDAMIVDVRNCPGGSADTVSYLASYFFGPEPRVLMNRFNRPMNRRMDSTTVDVPGKRRPDTDLYILTGRTGSACESFAFTLQQWGRAKTVGEKTSGAGNNNMLVDLGAGMTFSISIGSATHPKSGKGFEAVGVVPDIAVPAENARNAAHAEALRKLGKPNVTPDPIAEVRAAERAWLDAYEKRDAAAMNSLVADDFLITHGDGRTQDKAAVMDALARATAAGMPPATFTTEDVQGRVYGDTVILTGKVTMQRRKRDGTTSTVASRYTDAYARRNGRWQVVSSHQGTAADAPAPPAVAQAPAAKLDDYIGKYGVREVSLRDGALWFQRTGARGGVLKPLGRDQFDLNGDVVVTFTRDAGGKVVSLRIDFKDGRSDTAARD